MAESEEQLKSLLTNVKEESETAGLKLDIQKSKIMATSTITSWQVDRETMIDFIFLGSKITADGDCSHEIKRSLLLGRKVMKNQKLWKRQGIKKQRHHLLTKVPIVKAMVFPVVMYGCESWTIKKAEHWIIDAFELVLQKTLESLLDHKEIKPVNPKGNQLWIFIGRTDAEVPILWPLDVKSRLIEKVPDAGKDWGQEERGMTEDEMVEWHHQLNIHEFEQARGDGEGQGSLHAAVHGVTECWIRLRDWTARTTYIKSS